MRVLQVAIKKGDLNPVYPTLSLAISKIESILWDGPKNEECEILVTMNSGKTWTFNAVPEKIVQIMNETGGC